MAIKRPIDILEEDILKLDTTLLNILLSDRTTGNNILWATDDYIEFGADYGANMPILPQLITGEMTTLIQPRIAKSKAEQNSRTREKAEVFTPSWVCNAQNNLVDKAWFCREIIFNYEEGTTWRATKWAVEFPLKLQKTWKDYVRTPRLEISCGEAPYLTSRYDTVTGEKIKLRQRIGLLDRKLRVVNENAKEYDEWLHWVKEAYKSIYGYEYQGDNLLLARENLLLTFADSVWHKTKRNPTIEEMRSIAEIIAWNIWQMDGLKCVVPDSCHDDVTEPNMFGDTETVPCRGCEKGDNTQHNGVYCKIMDWETNKQIRFVDVVGGATP